MLRECNPKLATWIEIFRVALYVNEFYPDVEGYQVFYDWWNKHECPPKSFGAQEILRHGHIFRAVDPEALQTSVYWFALGGRWKPSKTDAKLSEKQLYDIAKTSYKIFFHNNDWRHQLGAEVTLETFRFLMDCAANGRLPIRFRNDPWPEEWHQESDAITKLHDIHMEYRFWLARQPLLTYSSVVRTQQTQAFTRAMPWQQYKFREAAMLPMQNYVSLPGRSQAIQEIKARADAIASNPDTKDWLKKRPHKPAWTHFNTREPRIFNPRLAIFEEEYLEAEKRRKELGHQSPANQKDAKPVHHSPPGKVTS